MGQMMDLRRKIEAEILKLRLDEFRTKGRIALIAGVVINLIDEDSPDDPATVTALKAAIKEVLNIE